MGTKREDYCEIIAAVIADLADELDIEMSNVIFYGGSAGGYSSFQIASKLPGVTVIADIPQTDLRTYHVKADIKEVVSACLGFESVSEVDSEFIHRLDLITRFIKEGRVPNFVILQNDLDYNHVESQMLSFKDRLEDVFNSLPQPKIMEYYVYSIWHRQRGGHVPLGRYATVNIVNKIIRALKRNERFLDLAGGTNIKPIFQKNLI